MTINQNERDFTFTLNKDLVKMNSATFLGTGSNTTVITGNSITQTAGTQTNTSTAAGNTIAMVLNLQKPQQMVKSLKMVIRPTNLL